MSSFTRFSHICPPKVRNVFTGVLLAQAIKLLNQSFCRPPKVYPISLYREAMHSQSVHATWGAWSCAHMIVTTITWFAQLYLMGVCLHCVASRLQYVLWDIFLLVALTWKKTPRFLAHTHTVCTRLPPPPPPTHTTKVSLDSRLSKPKLDSLRHKSVPYSCTLTLLGGGSVVGGSATIWHSRTLLEMNGIFIF